MTLYVSWSADRLNARAYHAAACATVGAAGFMASALLPASSFKVSHPPFPFLNLNTNRHKATIWLSPCCRLWSLCLYSAITWLDLLQLAQYRRCWTRDCSQHLDRYSWSDYWSVDLHRQGIKDRVSYWPLDELRYVGVCCRCVDCLDSVLPPTER